MRSGAVMTLLTTDKGAAMSGTQSSDAGSGRRDGSGSLSSISTTNTQSSSTADDGMNSMAVAGLAIACVALLLYATLFFFARELPNTQQELLKLSTNTPVLMRIMLTAGGALLLNVVAMALSAAGWIQTVGQSRLALAGVLTSGLMLLAFSFVVLLALLAPY
jgi:hypothetical protein